MHYARVKRNGDTDTVKQYHGLAPLERFLKYVEKPTNQDDCWIWKGTIDKGYGMFSVEGVGMTAHAASYRLHVGDKPEGMDVDHCCKNKVCVNPAHLDVVTRKENIRRKKLSFEEHFALRPGNRLGLALCG
jgi:hypothetical protein